MKQLFLLQEINCTTTFVASNKKPRTALPQLTPATIVKPVISLSIKQTKAMRGGDLAEPLDCLLDEITYFKSREGSNCNRYILLINISPLIFSCRSYCLLHHPIAFSP
ncbi:hypothetical protein Droror1_Dr00010331 [Drosera rotundifolia]